MRVPRVRWRIRTWLLVMVLMAAPLSWASRPYPRGSRTGEQPGQVTVLWSNNIVTSQAPSAPRPRVWRFRSPVVGIEWSDGSEYWYWAGWHPQFWNWQGNFTITF
jgi:hypothetical protein